MRYRGRFDIATAAAEWLDLLRVGKRVLHIFRHQRVALWCERRVLLQNLIWRHSLHK